MTKVFDKGLGEWLSSWKKEKLSEDVCMLINRTNHDLYFGPINDDPEYPGFVTACKRITKAIDDLPSTVYLNSHTGEVIENEPEDDGFTGWWVVGRPEILQNLVGKELSYYIK
jgi:hypothetical protein